MKNQLKKIREDLARMEGSITHEKMQAINRLIKALPVLLTVVETAREVELRQVNCREYTKDMPRELNIAVRQNGATLRRAERILRGLYRFA